MRKLKIIVGDVPNNYRELKISLLKCHKKKNKKVLKYTYVK